MPKGHTMTKALHIKSLKLRNFMCHTHFDFQLPETGVVVIQGSNGAGKSAVIEAIHWTLWGKTLRGSTPCPESGRTEVVADFHGLHVERSRKGSGTTKLFYACDDGVTVEKQSPSKTQDSLSKDLAMTATTWAATSVLAPGYAASFAALKDSEKKRLLETILNLEAFDNAAKLARKEHSAISYKVMDLAKDFTRADATHSALTEELKRLQEASRLLPLNDGELPKLRERLKRYQRQLADAQEERDECRRDASSADNTAAIKRTGISHLNAQIDKLDNEECPVCKRPMDSGVEGYRNHLIKGVEMGGAALKELEQVSEGAQESAEEARQQIVALHNRITNVQADITRIEAYAAVKKRDAERLSTLKAKITELEDGQLKVLRAEIKTHTEEMEVLDAVSQTLGLRGVRSQLLDGALAALEARANYWLSRLSPHASVSLASQKENADGTMADEISVSIDGFANGLGYKGASSGEKRRVDIAFLLGLSEMAAAAAGVDLGTLLVDELFDTLDPEGVEGACEALREVSQERCVVVITHRDDLAERLQQMHAERINL